MPLLFERNDITQMRVDAIVNAANESLLGGGGVDGAIHRAAGPKLLEECRTLGGCRTGEAKATRGYDLPCKWVIHTVGPVWNGGHSGEERLLRACYQNSLRVAKDLGCESVAFPLIASGVYGYPKREALRVAIDAINGFLRSEDMTVTIVLFSKRDMEPATDLLGEIRAYVDDVYVDAHLDEDVERRRAQMRRAHHASAPRETAPAPRETAPAPKMSRGLLGRLRKNRSLPPPPPCPTMDAEPMEEASFDGMSMPDIAAKKSRAAIPDLAHMLDHLDASFSEALLRLIDERGLKDAECYRRANVDRRLFSKIRCDPSYRPSRQTALAFCLALHLSLEEAQALLNKAGYALSRSSKSDVVVEYCLRTRRYDINDINQVLFSMDLPLLGA